MAFDYTTLRNSNSLAASAEKPSQTSAQSTGNNSKIDYTSLRNNPLTMQYSNTIGKLNNVTTTTTEKTDSEEKKGFLARIWDSTKVKEGTSHESFLKHTEEAKKQGFKAITGAAKGWLGSILDYTNTISSTAEEKWGNPYADIDTSKDVEKPTSIFARPNMSRDEFEARQYNDTRARATETADKLATESANEIAIAKASGGENNKVMSTATDLVTNATQMGLDAITGVPQIAMFLRSAGSGAREAKEDGATNGQQLAYGTVKGAIEVATEKLADGLAGIYGKGAADELVEKIVGKLAKTDTGRTVLRGIANAVGEGAEEGLSDILDPFAKLIYDTDTRNKMATAVSSPNGMDRNQLLAAQRNGANVDTKIYDLSDIGYDFLIGAAMGALGGATNVMNGTDAKNNAELKVQDTAKEINTLDRGNRVTTEDGYTTYFTDNNNGSTTINIVSPDGHMNRYNVENGVYTENTLLKEETARHLNELRNNAKNTNKNATQETSTVGNEINQPNAKKPTETVKPQENAKQTEATQSRDFYTTVRDDNTRKFAADFSEKDLDRALDTGKITVFSSEEITNGTKVSPSKLDALREAGTDGQIYSMEVPVDEVSWNTTLSGTYNENVVTDEMAEAEYHANAKEPAPKGYEKVLNKESEKRTEGIAEREKKAKESVTKKVNSKVEYWKGQTQETKAKTARKSDVNKAAKTLLEETGSHAQQKTISDGLQKLSDYVVSHDGETMDSAEIESMAREIADNLVNEIYETEIDYKANKTHEHLKDYLKWHAADPETGERTLRTVSIKNHKGIDANATTRHLRNVIKFSDNGQDIADLYNELANLDEFKGLFKDDIAPGDMLEEIENVYNETKENVNIYLSGSEKSAYASILTDAIIDLAIGDSIRETQQTRADKAVATIGKLKSDLAKEKASKKEAVAEVKAQYKAKEAENKAKQERKAILKSMNDSMDKIDEKLTKNNKKKNVKEGHKELADALLKAHDLITDASEEGQMYTQDALSALEEAYSKTKDSGDSFISDVYDENVEQALGDVRKKYSGKHVSELSNADLKEIAKAFKMVSTTINNANKTFKTQQKSTVSDLRAKAISEIESVAPKKKINPLRVVERVQELAWQNLKPIGVFDTIGSEVLSKEFEGLRNGEDTYANDVEEAKNFASEQMKKYGYDSWKPEKTVQFKTEDGTLDLDLWQRMEIYAYSKRQQALPHLTKGGVVLKTVKGKLLGADYDKVSRDANPQRLSDENIKEISNSLTSEQKAFADALQKYLSNNMASKGNEVSNALYGISIFNDDSYFKIKSDTKHLKSDYSSHENAQIKNADFTKDVSPNAQTPIVLGSFMEDWAEQVNNMANYHAFVLPLEDFNRVYNYKSNGKTVKSALADAYGEQAVRRIDNMLKSLNGGARADSVAATSNKFLSKFKKSAVFASASVFAQQGTAVVRAMAYVNPKYWGTVKLSSAKHKALWNELKEYAPVAKIKEMGYFDTNVGRSTSDYLVSNEYKGLKEKVHGFVHDSNYRDEVFSKAPSYADEVAWTTMWEAVKKETEATTDLKPGSKEFLEKAGKRFTDVCIRTQVYDSTLARSEFMRSTDGAVKMATTFMAEPTTVMNMLSTAVVQAKRGDSTALRNTIGAVGASIALNSVISSMVQAARDDDEDQSYAEKYVEALGDSMLNDFLLAIPNSLPYIRDIVSLFQGYDVERTDMSIAGDMINAFRKIKSEDTTDDEKMRAILEEVSYLTGVPLNNINRDLRAIGNIYASRGRQTTDVGLKDSFMQGFAGTDYSKTEISDRIVDAYINGDTKTGKELAYHYGTAPESIRLEDGEEPTALTPEEADKYVETYTNLTDEYYTDLVTDDLFDELTDDEIANAFDKVDNKIKTICENNFKQSHDVKVNDVNTEDLAHLAILCAMSGNDDVKIDDMRKLIGGTNEYTALDEKNVKAYYSAKDTFSDAVDDEDYKTIDKTISEIMSSDSNLQTVIAERNSDVKKLIEYASFDEPVGAETYYTFKNARTTAKTDMNNGNENGQTWFYALTQLDDVSTIENILKNDSSSNNTKGRRELYFLLKDYGYTPLECLQIYESIDGSTYEGKFSMNDRLSAKEVTYMLMNNKKIPDEDKSAIYEKLKELFNQPYALNDWQDWSYESNKDFITRNGYTYGNNEFNALLNSANRK